MTFLPIVERELRVSSRRRFTYWSRLVAAGFLLIIFSMVYVFIRFEHGMPWSPGLMAFTVLKWVAFLLVSGLGLFLPADSLSEEKREGTLGLLFLTNLRGHDVVLGKLCSLALQSFYGMVAIFPVLALPLMLGGVTGVEVGRTVLVMCNTLFFAVAVGLLVSSMSREALKTINAAFFLSLFFWVGLPYADFGLAKWDFMKFRPVLSTVSPGYLFTTASYLPPPRFWTCLLAQFGLAWLFLGAASVITPRAWQERTKSKTGLLRGLWRRMRFGGKRARLRFRKKWLAQNPALWLALRDRWLARFIWLFTFLLLAVIGCELCFWYIEGRNDAWRDYFVFPEYFLLICVCLWLSSQACRFYIEARRMGALELILVTPVSPLQLIRAQRSALRRTFWVPILFIFASRITRGVLENMEAYKWQIQNNVNKEYFISSLLGWTLLTVNLGLMLLAVGWFGMWMGLTSRNITTAVLKTLLLVCILPFFLAMFILMCSMIILTEYFKKPDWWGAIPPAGFALGVHLFFILWSRWRLLTKFRERATHDGRKAPRGFAAKFRPAPLSTPPPALVS